jgi:hypothetical protein
MSLNGKLIYDGESYALFQRYRLGIRHPMCCTFVAILKQPSEARAATFREKAYLIAVVGELAKLGVVVGSDELETVFDYFAQAVFARGYVAHQVFFSPTPREAAEFFA